MILRLVGVQPASYYRGYHSRRGILMGRRGNALHLPLAQAKSVQRQLLQLGHPALILDPSRKRRFRFKRSG